MLSVVKNQDGDSIENLYMLVSFFVLFKLTHHVRPSLLDCKVFVLLIVSESSRE